MINPKTTELKDRIISMIKKDLPVVSKQGNTFDIEDLTLREPEGIGNIQKQIEMKYSGKGNLQGAIRGKMVIKNKTGKTISKSALMDIVPVPFLTERNTYLINGSEKSLSSQMRIKPGAYITKADGKSDIKANLFFANDFKSGKYMPTINVLFAPSSNNFEVTVGKDGVKLNGINFLRQMGFNDTSIKKMLGNNNIADSLMEKYGNKNQKSIKDIYKAITRLPAPETDAETRKLLEKFFTENATFGSGQQVIENNLGSDSKHLNNDIIEKTMTKTFAVSRQEVKEDDKDDFRFKDIYDDNDFIIEKIEPEWEKVINKAKEMIDTDSEDINFTNLRPVLKVGDSLRKFFSVSGNNKTGTVVLTPEQTNPLYMAGLNKRITQFGEGGVSKDAVRNQSGMRNLASGAVNKVDPIDTPESENIGLVQHLTQAAKITNKTITIPVYPVSNGVADAVPGNIRNITSIDEYKHKVAFYDTRYLEKKNDKIKFTQVSVPCRYQGKLVTIPAREVEYVDTAAQNLLGVAANMIPFVHHNDGMRALMGSAMQKQSIILKNREVPLVDTAVNGDKNFTYSAQLGKEFGKPIHSTVDGIVHKITDDKIIIKDSDGKTHEHSYHNYFPLNQHNYINNDLKVKPGDAVKQGDMIAEGWHTKDGNLALGVNTKIGFLPYKGYNYEDGIVISQNYAKKMSTEEMIDIEFEVPKNEKGGRGSSVQHAFDEYTTDAQIKSNLDSDGIIKVGKYIKSGSILIATLRPVVKLSDAKTLSERIKASDKTLKFEPHYYKVESNSYIEGEVKRVTIINNPDSIHKQKIIVTVIVSKPIKLGDKVAGRHGNKGTVTKILSDDEMPVTEDGKPLELLFSPLAVPSRKNLGQLFETNAGLIAEKTGKKFVVDNFNHTEKDRVIKGLSDIGIPDGKMKVFLKEKQIDGSIKHIPVENPITVGNMYIMKLKHKVDDKIQSRSNLETPPTKKEFMPSKVVGNPAGEKRNPQSLGEMEMRALQGHGAVWNILESSTIKADGGGDVKNRIAIFNALADPNGKLDGVDMSATPETVNIMADSLKALGLHVKPMNGNKVAKSFDDVYDSVHLAPFKQSDLIRLIGEKNEVTKGDALFKAKDIDNTAKIKKEKIEDGKKKKKKPVEEKEDEPVKGGLIDPHIFGELDDEASRKKWGYIKLVTPMPNPILMQETQFNPYSLLTKMSSDSLKKLSNGALVIVINPHDYKGFDNMKKEAKAAEIATIEANMAKAGVKPGDTRTPKELEDLIEKHGEILWKTSGDAVQFMLDKVDIDKELVHAKNALDKAHGADIDKAYKTYKTLASLKSNGLTASDLMMHYVPVLPTYYRPVKNDKDDKTNTRDDLNDLYANIIKHNNSMKGYLNNGFDLQESYTPTQAAKSAGGLYNKITDFTGHTTAKNPKTKTELRSMKDYMSGKDGLIRSKMLSKRVDFSGRSVIGVDPALNLDEVGIPIDMAKYVYKPFIIKELIKQGYADNNADARRRWGALDDATKHVINDIAKDRPIMINRQPSLHKFSIQAFKPIIKETQDGDVVRSIHLNPMIVTGLNADFDGDTVAIHTPITEKAKEETKKLMMPSSNLINPTNGSMVVEIRHEMALGLYYLTIKHDEPKGNTHKYADYKTLRQDFMGGKIDARTKVNIAGVDGVTAGQALFNLLIPERYRDYHKIWNSSAIGKLLKKMYEDGEKERWKTISTTEISNIIDKLKTLGFESATRAGVSIGVNDFKKIDGAQKIFDRNVAESAKTIKDPEQALIDGWRKAEKEIESNLKKGVLAEDNPLQIMMASGARAKADQIRRMMATVGVGMDVSKSLVSPIVHSNFDGLSAQEYWKHGFDARKGVYDRSVATSKPGELTRGIWSATQDVVVKADDCGSRDGIDLKKGNPTVVGRYAAEDVVGSDHRIYCRRNQMITKDIQDELCKDDDLRYIKVRSPLRCKTIHGVCQKCYGAMPGTLQVPKLGTAIGVLASQAMGEPVTQMTMNTFHSGGTNSNATLGIPRVESILGLKAGKGNEATLSKVTGKVEHIEIGKPGTFDTITINKTPHKVSHLENGESKILRIGIGDTVAKGDFLTLGNIRDLEDYNSDTVVTDADPRELLKLKSSHYNDSHKGLADVQDYLSNAMEYAFAKTTSPGTIDRRHIETIIGKLTSQVKIHDAGDSHFTKGESIDRNIADKWNAENTTPYSIKKLSVNNTEGLLGRKAAETYKDTKGKVIVQKGNIINADEIKALAASKNREIKVSPNPIIHENELNSQDTIVPKGHQNWLSNTGHENVYRQLARGATYGQTDKLDDLRSRLMTGKLLNIGSGFSVPKEVANNISTNMQHFFSKLDFSKKK